MMLQDNFQRSRFEGPVAPIAAHQMYGQKARYLSGVLGSALLLLTVSFPCHCLAQILYGSIAGSVTDPKGLVVPGAVVTLIDTDTNTSKLTKADASGAYQFEELNPGRYRLSVSSGKFKSTVLIGISVQANEVVREDVQLTVGSVSETVTVSSLPPPLQTEDGTIAFDLDAAQIEDLPPNAARSYQPSFLIIPGFSGGAGGGGETQNPGNTNGYNVNGVSSSNNNTTIDGVSDYYPFFPQNVAYNPSNDAIQTVNVVTNSFQAEQGTAAGAAINVITKSGTNRFHGNSWEYNAISALNARSYFNPPNYRIPKSVNNNFGGNIGGPILRNRAFFFFNFERQRRARNASGFQTLPLDVYRGADKSGNPVDANFQGTGVTIYDPLTGSLDASGRPVGRQPFPNNTIPANRISTAAAKLVALIPEPNLLGSIPTTQLVNNNFNSLSTEYTRDVYDGKINVTPTAKTTGFARYGAQRTYFTDPPALGLAGGNALDGSQPGISQSLIQSVGFGGTHTFNPKVLLDANAGYTRQGLSAEDYDINSNVGSGLLGIPGTNGPDHLQGGTPTFGLNTFTSLGNTNISSPFRFRDSTFSNADNLTVLIGHHALRTGFTFRHYLINHFSPNVAFGPRGGFTFSGAVTSFTGATVYKATAANPYTSFADFLLGLPTASGKDVQVTSPATLRETDYAFYVQDQWRATNKLSLTYGLRFELYPLPHHDHFGFSRFDPLTQNVILGGINGQPNNAGVHAGGLNYGPRFGFAYSVDKNTVVRGGYGITTNPDNFRQMVNAYPTIVSQNFTNSTPNLPTTSLGPIGPVPAALAPAFGTLTQGIPAITAIPSLASGAVPLPLTLGTQTYPTNYRRGYIESYNVGIQHIFPLAIQLNVAYVGTLVIREVVGRNLNASGPGEGITGIPIPGTSPQQYVSGTGGALFHATGATSQPTMYIPSGTANYNGLQTVIKRRFAPTMFGAGSIGFTYVYSKAIDDYIDNSDTSSANGQFVNYQPLYYRNRAVAGFDSTHSFAGFGNYVLPFGKGHAFLQRGIGSVLLGGFQLDTISYYRTGNPVTVTSSVGSNAVGSSQFANQIKPNVRLDGGHLKGLAYPEFDVTAYRNPAANTIGNAGRNALRAFPLFSINLGASRSFKIKDWATVRFQAQAYDITNTPFFGAPATNVSAATFDANGNIINRNGFGSTTAAFVSRNMQLSGRITF